MTLETENLKLKCEIKDMKENHLGEQVIKKSNSNNQKVRGKRRKQQFKDHEEYVEGKLIKKLHQDPQEVRFSTIDQAFTNMSEMRVEYIKQGFNDILQNISSTGTKCFRAMFKSTRMTEIIRRVKLKKRQAKYKDKNKNPLEHFFDKKWSNNFEEFIISERLDIWKYFRIISTSAQKLIELRNQILNATKDYKKIFEDSKAYNLYTKQDIANMFEFKSFFEGSEYLTPHSLWDIPLKTHQNEYYNEAELSE